MMIRRLALRLSCLVAALYLAGTAGAFVFTPPILFAGSGVPFSHTVFVLNGTTSWAVPSNFLSLTSVDCIGAGASGNTNGTSGNLSGGGGGAWGRSTGAQLSAITLTPGVTVVNLAIGLGGASITANTTLGNAGGATYFNATSLANAVSNGSTLSLGCQGGQAGTTSAGGLGGATASGVGGSLNAGGNGGHGANANGGGGAAGSTGVGQAASGSMGGAGDGGVGGTGGTQHTAGGNGTEYQSSPAYGSGGGGGSGGPAGSNDGGAGGTYGAGGGASFNAGSGSGAGANGLMVIQYLASS
jgi:hypothetical protein